MPHAGGGSSGGGFHSSTSSSSSTPKYDSYGRPHSSYYVMPGYYYHRRYIPFNPVNRTINAIKASLFGLIFVTVFVLITTLCVVTDTKYSYDKLVDRSIDKYYEVYSKTSANFEDNILISIITYENGKEYDYVSIVGDNINITVDEMFGSEKTLFGSFIYKKINDNYTNMYEVISLGIQAATDNISEQYLSLNREQSKIVNESSYHDFGDESRFMEAEKEFFQKTGYHISLYIGNEKDFYKPTYIVLVAVGIIGLIIFVICILDILQGIKASKAVTEAEQKGMAKDLFEGEVDFDEFIKQYSHIDTSNETKD